MKIIFNASWKVDSDQVCLPKWRRKEGVHSIGATEVEDSANVNSLTKCLIHCQSTVGCLAVDFNHLENSCWMHFDPAYNSSDRQDCEILKII